MPTPQEQHEAEALASQLEALARTSLNVASTLRSLRDKSRVNYRLLHIRIGHVLASAPPLRSAARWTVGPSRRRREPWPISPIGCTKPSPSWTTSTRPSAIGCPDLTQLSETDEDEEPCEEAA